ncbi:MAG TPA: FAD-dependent oxidoreductase [Solirubrobacterales bacterium]|nr:FAD-dependent oxidoreductase [Solirubrobacterales bacterium]
MSAQPQTFVIVGGGLAGAKAAETLREEGFDGRLVLIGDEAERPYERPPLSKEYLRGETAERPYVHGEDFYAERGIELWTSARVTGVDAGRGELRLEDDRRLGYDRLLLATGAEPRRLDVPGAELAGILYLRTVADSERIAERFERGRRVVVVGSGWIGAEIAASARMKGCEVTMIEMATLPLERVLGPEVGQIYLDVHRDHGIEFLPETTVERFEGEGSLERVLTRDGALIETDVAIVGVGVTPRVQLAEAAGLRVENGILVDERLESSVPGVFAAGDVANAHHPFYERRLRVEHWANALNQGPAAARAMLGEPVSYDEIPYFFSDQYETGMEYAGFAPEWDEVVFRGDVAGREFIAFWLAEGRVVAGLNMNVWDVNEEIRELIRSRQPVDAKRLADADVGLEELAGVTR